MKDVITFEDFVKLDLRVGEIVEVTEPEWGNKLLEMKVDLGDGVGKRIIMAGVKQWYKPEDLKGKKGVFVVNLAPKKMSESESQGMMLMSDCKDGPKPVFVERNVSNGTVVR